ncbi:hypothetical protein FRC08_005385 [Ceratobasidium sp. 394]|nr:hypothetical protein FRC08_005385 [Ceratobasidium sp. 394]
MTTPNNQPTPWFNLSPPQHLNPPATPMSMAAPEPMTLEALREYAAGLGLALQPVDAAPPYETVQPTPVALPSKTAAFTKAAPPTKVIPAQAQALAPT